MANCQWCEEPVLAGEHRDEHFQDQAMHIECGFRAVVGSVAHLLRRCSCCHPGSGLGDPPALSKREAAVAAYTLWLQITEWYGSDVDIVNWLGRSEMETKTQQHPEIGRELRVSELQPRTIVILQKVGTNVAYGAGALARWAATMWVVDVGEVYVHFHAGAALTDFFAVRCGEDLEEITDDAHNRLKIFEYLGEP